MHTGIRQGRRCCGSALEQRQRGCGSTSDRFSRFNSRRLHKRVPSAVSTGKHEWQELSASVARTADVDEESELHRCEGYPVERSRQTGQAQRPRKQAIPQLACQSAIITLVLWIMLPWSFGLAARSCAHGAKSCILCVRPHLTHGDRTERMEALTPRAHVMLCTLNACDVQASAGIAAAANDPRGG